MEILFYPEGPWLFTCSAAGAESMDISFGVSLGTLENDLSKPKSIFTVLFAFLTCFDKLATVLYVLCQTCSLIL